MHCYPVALAVRSRSSILSGRLEQKLGSDRQFDVIGFDVRGVGETTPPIGCFKNDLVALLSGERLSAMSPIDSSSQALRYYLEFNKGFWDLCI